GGPVGAGSPGAGSGGGAGAPTISPGAKPGGFGRVASRCRPDAASPASYNPPLRPIRGSSDGARGLDGTCVLADAGGVVCPVQSTGKETHSESERVAALRKNREIPSAIMVSP